ncbi:hypothetical protein [Gordonia rhizosphera]|uniref:Uncharacterized protein n=1 Tax=Gordonia rhizosphera NBRC 16068 TaxID=1108045 RepID=K6X384_9ACTN|nr:hypothetical protein [Gordonia rhizosphera]GAB93259.1 hypothetical protein GORHZ_213_00340 [Gordonia rhizosphera NBRC 16068]
MSNEYDPHSPAARLLIAPPGRIPRATDVRHVMTRLGLDTEWSDAAISQLIDAAAAAERWLPEKPENAARMVADPVGAIAEMRQAGLLSGPIDELVDALQHVRARLPDIGAEGGQFADITSANVEFRPTPTTGPRHRPDQGRLEH